MLHRNYVFTLNNYTIVQSEQLVHWELPKYLIFGREIGDNGTPHLQGYVEFKRAYSIKQLKVFNSNIHWEQRRGTAKQAADYCRKDGDVYERGTMSRQGQRKDIENVANMAFKGKSNKEIAQEFPTVFMKFHRGIHALKQIADESNKEFRNVEVIVLHGSTGTGKTKEATKDKDYFKLDVANNVWFDGYDGHSHLIIDDFYGWIKHGHLLNILDGHPLRLEIKGGFTYAKWTKVTITSNDHPSHWYRNISAESEKYKAHFRRITQIKEIKQNVL